MLQQDERITRRLTGVFQLIDEYQKEYLDKEIADAEKNAKK